MVQPTHQPDAVLTLRVTPALRARLGELLERVPDTGAARLSRHGRAVWCLERGLLEAEAEPALVLRAPGWAPTPSKPSVSIAPVAETSTPSKPSPSREKRSKPTTSSSPSSKTSTSPPTTTSSSPSGNDADALRARWRALVTVQGQGARAVGVSQSWVSRWLAGEKTGSPETLARVAAHLDALAATG